jgi:N-acyl homoserine lactone hydrolase
MRMHILSGGRIRMKKSTYIHDADRSEMIDLPVSCALLRHPQGNVLFDTGCHPSIAEDPEPRWGALTKFMLPIMSRDDNVISDLRAVGLVPDDIDVVVCSHLHTDHCGCNAFFSKAAVIIHALELEAAKAPDAARIGYLRADWDHPMPMTTISKQTDVMGDGRIVLIPLPGHTPGTTGALIELDRSGRFLPPQMHSVSEKTSIERSSPATRGMQSFVHAPLTKSKNWRRQDSRSYAATMLPNGSSCARAEKHTTELNLARNAQKNSITQTTKI